MNQFNRVMGFAAFACLLAPVNAFADSWTCVNNNLVREVRIQYAGSAPVPCSVVYNKPDEDASSQVLWTADNRRLLRRTGAGVCCQARILGLDMCE